MNLGNRPWNHSKVSGRVLHRCTWHYITLNSFALYDFCGKEQDENSFRCHRASRASRVSRVSLAAAAAVGQYSEGGVLCYVLHLLLLWSPSRGAPDALARACAWEKQYKQGLGLAGLPGIHAGLGTCPRG